MVPAARRDLNRLRLAVEDVSAHCADFPRNHGRSGSETGNHDLSVGVRRIGSERISGAVRDGERDARERLRRAFLILCDNQIL